MMACNNVFKVLSVATSSCVQMMAQTRIGLQDENCRLQSQVRTGTPFKPSRPLPNHELASEAHIRLNVRCVFVLQVYLLSAKTGKYSSSNESQLKASPASLAVEAPAPLSEGAEMPEFEVEEMLAAPVGAFPRSTTTLPV
jgi:hypothetical protein